MSPSVRRVVESAAEVFGLTVEQILGGRRRADIAMARHIAMFVARRSTTLSLNQIAVAFDRDHTTVMHACHKIEALCKIDPVVAGHIEAVWAGSMRRETADARDRAALVGGAGRAPPGSPSVQIR